MKTLNLYIVLLFFFNANCFAQKSNITSYIIVDSLVRDFDYAKEKILLISDKYRLIDSLLTYEGDLRENPTWKAMFDPPSDEVRSSTNRLQNHITNQAAALYLIEVLIRNKFLFQDASIPLYCENSKDNYVYNNIKALFSLGDYNDILKLDKGLDEQRIVLNEHHFKNLFHYYKKWFKEIKQKEIKFDDLSDCDKSVLINTDYGWTIEDLQKK